MLTGIERRFERLFLMSGGMVLLFAAALRELHFGRRDLQRIGRQMLAVGYSTLPLAALINLFTGMTLALNTGFALSDYGQVALIPPIVALSMAREMGPVITAVIIVGRVGAAMAAELGTMSVSDELDVLRVLGIRCERYLVMPRVMAALVMTPLLTVYALVIGLIGGALVSSEYFGLTYQQYYDRAIQALTLGEIFKGLLKAVVFGAIFSTVCCYLGLVTSGGAEGVGRSTTKAVVIALSGILVANYLLTRFLFG